MNKIIYKYNDVYNEPHQSLKLKYGDTTLFFSSDTNLKRFKRRLEETKSRFDYWKNVFNINQIDMTILELIYTYENVEKRGFLIKTEIKGKEVEFKCQEEMKNNLYLTLFKE